MHQYGLSVTVLEEVPMDYKCDNHCTCLPSRTTSPSAAFEDSHCNLLIYRSLNSKVTAAEREEPPHTVKEGHFGGGGPLGSMLQITS